MKKNNTAKYLFLLNLVLFFLFSPKIQAIEKYALIVGISDYKNPSGSKYIWPYISSDNDIALVKNALLKQGFKAKNIVAIKDKECTRDFILKVINDSLTSRVKSGDVVVFHFSGHGQRIWDNIGIQQDGYDQSLACYDSPAGYLPGDDKHLRGAQLGKELNELRSKLGLDGSLLVVLDACHSGSGTRGTATSRGIDYIYAPPGYIPKINGPGTKKSIGFDLVNDNKKEKLANMVCFYACSPHESNFEYSFNDTGYGSLSFAFSKELSLADQNTSYKTLWDKIRGDMAIEVPDQTPEYEGDLDYKILGGNAVPHSSYNSVVDFSSDAYSSDGTVWVNSGELSGISDGSVFTFYPAGTVDTTGKKPLCTGKVIQVSLYKSQVVLNQKQDAESIASSSVYLKNVAFSLSLTVNIAAKDENIKTRLKQIFHDNDFSFVTICNTNADMYIDYNSTGKLILLTNDEVPFDSIPNWDNAGENFLRQKLLEFAKWKFTKNLNDSNPEFNFSVKLLPIYYTMQQGRWGKFDHYLDTINNDSIVFRANGHEGFYMQFFNYTPNILYINVLDITPNGHVNVLVPNKTTNDPVDVIALYPYKSYILKKIIGIGPPYGNEITKFICSNKEFDLSSVFTSATRGISGPETAFEVMYHNVTAQTRDALATSEPPGEVNIKNIDYKIVPPVKQ